jgi:hypothetical protein
MPNKGCTRKENFLEDKEQMLRGCREALQIKLASLMNKKVQFWTGWSRTTFTPPLLDSSHTGLIIPTADW